MLRILAAVLALALCVPAGASVVYLNGGVNSYTAEVVEQAVQNIGDAPSLRLVINSPGGEVFSGLRIIRALRASPVPVICEVQDMAASMAAVILQSQGCQTRVVAKHSILMFHETSVSFGGTFREGDSQALADMLRVINRAIATIPAARLGLTVDEYLARTTGGREIWIAGIDAVAAGAADRLE
jgi:ATP-dependent protease ClpP protease subunit